MQFFIYLFIFLFIFFRVKVHKSNEPQSSSSSSSSRKIKKRRIINNNNSQKNIHHHELQAVERWRRKKKGEVCGYISQLSWQKGLKYKVSIIVHAADDLFSFWNIAKTTTFIQTRQSFRTLEYSCLSHGTLEELAEISEIGAAFPLGFLSLKELFPTFLFPHFFQCFFFKQTATMADPARKTFRFLYWIKKGARGGDFLNFNCVYLYTIIHVRPYDPFKWQCCFGDSVADCTWKVSSSLIQRTNSVYPSLKERPSSLVVNMVVLFDRKITKSSRAISPLPSF